MTEKERLDYLASQGINIKTGMRYADDSIEFYEQLIGIFLEEYEEKSHRAEELVNDSGNGYAVLVHGLKNNARALGAEELADLAYEHEKAAKANDRIYVVENLADLLKIWEKTAQIFKKNNN